jgi:hypothetical protein
VLLRAFLRYLSNCSHQTLSPGNTPTTPRAPALTTGPAPTPAFFRRPLPGTDALPAHRPGTFRSCVSNHHLFHPTIICMKHIDIRRYVAGALLAAAALLTPSGVYAQQGPRLKLSPGLTVRTRIPSWCATWCAGPGIQGLRKPEERPARSFHASQPPVSNPGGQVRSD